MIAIHAGKPKGGMKEALKIEPDKVRRLSLSEQALEKAAEVHGTDVVRYISMYSIHEGMKLGKVFFLINYHFFFGFCSNGSSSLVRFTQRNILRVYPKGTRFNSSNYKPLIGWMHGAQMVAFNMQVPYLI